MLPDNSPLKEIEQNQPVIEQGYKRSFKNKQLIAILKDMPTSIIANQHLDFLNTGFPPFKISALQVSQY